MTEMTRAEFEGRLIARAAQDDAYRARLIAEPRAAIAEELGIDPGDGIAFEVVEETPKKLYLVLPPSAARISDEELETIAGGNEDSGGDRHIIITDPQSGAQVFANFPPSRG